MADCKDGYMHATGRSFLCGPTPFATCPDIRTMYPLPKHAQRRRPPKPPKWVPVGRGTETSINLDQASAAVVAYAQARHDSGSVSKLTKHAVVRRALSLYADHLAAVTDWEAEAAALESASAKSSPAPDSEEATAVAAAVAQLSDPEGCPPPLADVLSPPPLVAARRARHEALEARVDAHLDSIAAGRGALANKLRAAGYGGRQ